MNECAVGGKELASGGYELACEHNSKWWERVSGGKELLSGGNE